MSTDLRLLSSDFWRRVLPLAAMGILWLDLIRLLSHQWEAREQYAYGWFVPFFAAALLWRRWLDRPAIEKIESRKQKAENGGRPSELTSDLRPLTSDPCPPSSAPSGLSFHPSSVPFLLSAFCFLLFVLLLPLRVIFEINTDWPLIAWVYTSSVVALTLCVIFLAGGWKWVRHFAFPVAFILIAVVWPYRIEKGLTQNLMQIVAALTVEILGWLDVPAMHRGNLIELSTGVLGVDEACSGIRSFQSSIMAGLLMGELYRMKIWSRAVLLVSGALLSFGFNVVRTLILSYQANKEGLSAIDKWHDPAGMTITVACFFGLWALALLLRRWTSAGDPPSTDDLSGNPQSAIHPPRTSDLRPLTSAPSAPSSPLRLDRDPSPAGAGEGGRRPGEGSRGKTNIGGERQGEVSTDSTTPQVSGVIPHPSPLTSDLRPPTSDPKSQISAFSFLLSALRNLLSPFRLPPWRLLALALGCWALLSIGATELWYRSHANPNAGEFYWTAAMPTDNPSYQKVDLPPRTLKLLSFDEGASGKWTEDGVEWSAHFFRWQPRSIQSVIQSRIHRPERCLPASGFKQVSESALIGYDAGPLQLPFRKYVFQGDTQTLYVFFCQWEDGAEKQIGMGASNQEGRLQSVLTGRRQVGQQTLELILAGCKSLEAAEQAVRKRLPELIRIDPKPPRK